MRLSCQCLLCGKGCAWSVIFCSSVKQRFYTESRGFSRPFSLDDSGFVSAVSWKVMYAHITEFSSFCTRKNSLQEARCFWRSCQHARKRNSKRQVAEQKHDKVARSYTLVCTGFFREGLSLGLQRTENRRILLCCCNLRQKDRRYAAAWDSTTYSRSESHPTLKDFWVWVGVLKLSTVSRQRTQSLYWTCSLEGPYNIRK